MAGMPGGLPEWDWPESVPTDSRTTEPNGGPSGPSGTNPQPVPRQRRRHYGPRTCRICLEVVQPKFPNESTFGLGTDRPTYTSEDHELGRLISPCRCKGSQRYVHEGCLQAWRLADPTRQRNYFECPTCKFRYRLGRLSWGRWMGNQANQVALTIFIIALVIFLLGFVADPILDLWLDPVSTIADTVSHVVADAGDIPEGMYMEDPASWVEHFVKGFFSLGVIGFLKVLLAMTPWQWWNLRSSGLMGGGRRPGNTGRGRVESISWALVAVGALSFMYTVWKGVRAFSRKFLQMASDNVLDVGGDDEDDDDDE